jgi:hypothetical protein
MKFMAITEIKAPAEGRLNRGCQHYQDSSRRKLFCCMTQILQERSSKSRRSKRSGVVEIDHYGERLVGCIECNRWSWRGSKRLFMELPEEDLEALKNVLWKRTASGSAPQLLTGVSGGCYPRLSLPRGSTP